MEVRAIVDCKTSLGEGPLWDVEDQKIYWIDSLGNKLFRAEADGSAVEVWDVPIKDRFDGNKTQWRRYSVP